MRSTQDTELKHSCRYSLLFATRGANVVVNDVSKEAAQKVVDEITKGARTYFASGSVLALTVDPTSWGQGCCQLLLSGGRRRCHPDCSRRIRGHHYPHQQCRYITVCLWNLLLSVAFNGALHFSDKSVKNMTDQEWDLVQLVHLKGAFSCTKAAWPHFRKQKFGRIVNTASAAGLYGTRLVLRSILCG